MSIKSKINQVEETIVSHEEHSLPGEVAQGKKRNLNSSSPAKRQRVWSTLSSSSATTGGETDPDDPAPINSPPRYNVEPAYAQSFGRSITEVPIEESDNYDTDDTSGRPQNDGLKYSYNSDGASPAPVARVPSMYRDSFEGDDPNTDRSPTAFGNNAVNADSDDENGLAGALSSGESPGRNMPVMYGSSGIGGESDDSDDSSRRETTKIPGFVPERTSSSGIGLDSDEASEPSRRDSAIRYASSSRGMPSMYGVGTSLSGDSDDTDDPSLSTSQKPMLGAGRSKNLKNYSKKEVPISKGASPGRRLLAKMGYREGTGLGKHGQGIKEPIPESKQKGRRGLGLKLPKVEGAAAEFLPSMEIISAKEEVEWLDGPEEEPPPFEELLPGIVVQERKQTIDDETEFCDPNILLKVISTKSILDDLESKEKMKARSRANPFETIRNVFFQNRAAMKMANMDAVFDFMFTEPRDQHGNKLLGPHDLLYFADVCAGPGGFTEYVLWRKGWRAKGVGFTLREKNDFKLEEFYAASCDTFEPYYGKHEDGDVYKPGNIDSLHEHVMNTTGGVGVHFMMADGGFDVEGQENIQEVLSKRLYLCQCLVALKIVRAGGHFVVKLFDLFTPFSAGLIYLMYRCFKHISLHKPNTSRPANSERYLICKIKRDGIEGVIKYMETINKKLDRLDGGPQDIRDIYPIEILTDRGSQFFEYLWASNNKLGDIQYVQLLKFIKFYNDGDAVEVRQGNLREECLELWKVPDKTRHSKPIRQPSDMATTFLGSSYVQDFSKPVQELKGPLPELQARLKNASDCYCCVVGGKSNEREYGSQPTLFIGLGGSNVYRYERNGKWVKLKGERFKLSRDTLVLGEVIRKFKGGGTNQTFVDVFYIIDAAILGGERISDKPVSERLRLCGTFARALYRQDNEIFASLMFPLRNLKEALDNLSEERHKNTTPCLGYRLDDVYFLKPSGLLCIPRSKSPWIRGYSTTTNKEYYYNTASRKSYYEKEKTGDIDADFKYTLQNMGLWSWDGVRFYQFQHRADNALQFDVMHDFSTAK